MVYRNQQFLSWIFSDDIAWTSSNNVVFLISNVLIKRDYGEMGDKQTLVNTGWAVIFFNSLKLHKYKWVPQRFVTSVYLYV